MTRLACVYEPTRLGCYCLAATPLLARSWGHLCAILMSPNDQVAMEAASPTTEAPTAKRTSRSCGLLVLSVLIRALLLLAGVLLIAAAQTVGLLGYHWIGELDWDESWFVSGMVLSGMNTVDVMPNAGAKWWQVFFILCSTTWFTVVVSIAIAPIASRIIYTFVTKPVRPRNKPTTAPSSSRATDTAVAEVPADDAERDDDSYHHLDDEQDALDDSDSDSSERVEPRRAHRWTFISQHLAFRMESMYEPLASVTHYAVRQAVVLVLGSLIIGLVLVLGMFGFHWILDTTWVDAFLNASLSVAGMGLTVYPSTTAGRVFAGFYVVVANIVQCVVLLAVLAPLLHRILHSYYLPRLKSRDRGERDNSMASM